MSTVLEVLVRHAADAERAAAGGADRVHLVGDLDSGGQSPAPGLVAEVCAATDLPVRVTLRLRPGFSTDGGELVRLQGLASSYRAAGAEGLVVGFLNAHTEIDVGVLTELVTGTGLPWTFDRAIDSCISTDRAWRELVQLPGLDQVLTAGSARGVAEGLDDLLRRAQSDPYVAQLIMAGGELLPEHVPWLARAGVRAFHIDVAARPLGSWKAYVDADLVGTWRSLVDAATQPR